VFMKNGEKLFLQDGRIYQFSHQFLSIHKFNYRELKILCQRKRNKLVRYYFPNAHNGII
jgi:hypothetical protein